MFQLLRYAKDYRKQIILGPFFKFLEAVFELILPLFMARLVDEGIARHDQGKVIEMAVAMLDRWTALRPSLSILCIDRFSRLRHRFAQSLDEKNQQLFS